MRSRGHSRRIWEGKVNEIFGNFRREREWYENEDINYDKWAVSMAGVTEGYVRHTMQLLNDWVYTCKTVIDT